MSLMLFDARNSAVDAANTRSFHFPQWEIDGEKDLRVLSFTQKRGQLCGFAESVDEMAQRQQQGAQRVRTTRPDALRSHDVGQMGTSGLGPERAHQIREPDLTSGIPALPTLAGL
jgi:hypothetical protein